MSYRPEAIADVAEMGALVERARAGDPSAFTQLIARRQDQLYRLAWSILRDDADARDAVQDACITAWRSLSRLRDPDRFDPWLTRSLVNRCRDMLRRRKRAAVREIRIAAEADGSGASRGGVGDAFIDADAIRDAFDHLNAGDRLYLALHYADGRSVAEIATLVDAPVGTVKWRLSRARTALERHLSRQDR